MSDYNHKMLTPADVEQAAHVIAEAFMDDPLVTFMLPFRSTRLQTLIKFFRIYGEINIRNQRAYGVGQPLQAVAFWIFPDQKNLSISIRMIGKLLPLVFTMYPLGMLRARKILEQINAFHEKYANEPHFYLDNLGVISSARGQGLSSKLIRPFLDMADEQKVIVYTDTVTSANIPFYEHFGFRLMEARLVPGTQITVSALRRPTGDASHQV
ncbi:MAG: GNAT family N-acetyltransferase [Chloroflexota bacterium]